MTNLKKILGAGALAIVAGGVFGWANYEDDLRIKRQDVNLESCYNPISESKEIRQFNERGYYGCLAEPVIK